MRRRFGPYLVIAVVAVVAWVGSSRRATGERHDLDADIRGHSDQATVAALVPYRLDWVSINSGGGVGARVGDLRLGASIGQHAAGLVASPTHKLGVGFWYGIAEACVCDCHADPKCDGLTTVHDVVFAVDVAFRGEPEIPDSNTLCPWTTTDVDCDGMTKVHDVVHLVNVAFRGEDPALEFCDPCGP